MLKNYERYGITNEGKITQGNRRRSAEYAGNDKAGSENAGGYGKLQSELDVKEHEITAGGGAVKVKIKGNREIVSLELSEEIVDPEDIETLQDLVIAAVNEALKTVEKYNSEAMNKVTAGLNVPGLI